MRRVTESRWIVTVKFKNRDVYTFRLPTREEARTYYDRYRPMLPAEVTSITMAQGKAEIHG